MPSYEAALQLECELSAIVIRADGTREKKRYLHRKSMLRRFYDFLRRSRLISYALTFGAFLSLYHSGAADVHQHLPLFALVTTAGVNYMASDFLSSSSARINAFQYHDCGTGTTAESTAQTALITPAGVTRVAGTGSNTSANIYQSVATIAFTSTLAITEWGLFSASTSGTMWDRRLFTVINVVNLDSIQFTYALTVPAGGS